MTTFSVWKTVSAIFLFWTATAIPSLAQTFKTLANFEGRNGYEAEGLAQGTDGNFYGMAFYGGTPNCFDPAGCGTVFKVTREGTLSTLHKFCLGANCPDGALPASQLTLGRFGMFYGTAQYGGDSLYYGTAFRVTPSGRVTTLYSFCAPGCAAGTYPTGRMLRATDENFYGATIEGGNELCNVGCGTIFKMTMEGTLTTLHAFNGSDGSSPIGQLLQSRDGNFYGVTSQGGDLGCNAPWGCGTVFKISAKGTFTSLYAFSGADGQFPLAGLVEGTDGNFYGTTSNGDNYNGTIFKITPSGTLTTLHFFDGSDGEGPAGLTLATDGNLYGTTAGGGSNGDGTVFEMTPQGELTALHSFNGTDGKFPSSGVIQATDGNFYGTTTTFGANGYGTVFSLSTGLGPFVMLGQDSGKIGDEGRILGQGFEGTTNVSLNGTPANFTVESDTHIRATVPAGATTGYVTVTTPSGTLTSNVPFRVIP